MCKKRKTVEISINSVRFRLIPALKLLLNLLDQITLPWEDNSLSMLGTLSDMFKTVPGTKALSEVTPMPSALIS